MISRRTISYIGLWALIMPWLGFSWGTKTVLFSLTGLLLLFIGNRYYNSEIKKEKKSDTNPHLNNLEQKTTEINEKDFIPNIPVSTYQPVPDYMYQNRSIAKSDYQGVARENLDSQEINTHKIAVSTFEDSVSERTVIKPKPRVQKKIETMTRPKRTRPKAISLDSLQPDYE